MAPILAGDKVLDLRPDAGQPGHPLASSPRARALLLGSCADGALGACIPNAARSHQLIGSAVSG